MNLVAQRGDDLFLLKDGDQGVIVDVSMPARFKPRPIDSILKQGYWQKHADDEALVSGLLNVPEIAPENPDAKSWYDRLRLKLSLLQHRAFCPTGQGGGIDNSCKPGGGGGGSSASSHPEMPAVLSSVLKHTGYNKEQLRSSLTADASPKSSLNAKVRARVAGSILLGGTAVPNAINHILNGHGKAAVIAKVAAITTGNVAAAQKEFADTPVYDLNVLSSIAVKSGPVSGEAVCNMADRSITCGSTTRSGSFRHELGHAIRSAWGGESHSGKTQMTMAAAKTYEAVLAKVKADPSGIKNKLSHDEYETKYGVVGRRSLDNWEENVAEHYRLYHREVYRDRKEGGGGKYLAQYRDRHPEWAKLWDAHYTAAMLGEHLAAEGTSKLSWFEASTLKLDMRAFCPTGVGGGVDNSCSPAGGGQAGGSSAGTTKVAQEIVEQAGKVKFDPETVTGSGAIGRREYDKIEEVLTASEKHELASHIDDAEREFAQTGMEDFTPEVDRDRVAQDEGYGHEDIRDEVANIVRGNTDLEEAVEDWNPPLHSSGGVDAIDHLMDTLDDIPEDVQAALDEYRSRAESRIEEAVADAEMEQQSEAEHQAAAGFDPDEARRQWLLDFYDDHEEEPRFQGSDQAPENTWVKSKDGSDILHFTTKSGRQFEISTHDSSMSGLDVKSIQFSDDAHDFHKTGKGEAFEVFSKVVPAVKAWVDKTNPEKLHFSAQGLSRQKLYDRLVKTLLKLDPTRAALLSDSGVNKHYLVVPKQNVEAIKELMNTAGYPAHEEIRSAKDAGRPVEWTEVEPEIDPIWFTPEGWDDDEDFSEGQDA